MSNTAGSNSTSASELGFVAQKRVVGAYIEAASTMKSVTVTDSKGRPLSKPEDVRKGPDGGVDAKATINAKRPQDVSRVATMLEKKIRKILPPSSQEQ